MTVMIMVVMDLMVGGDGALRPGGDQLPAGSRDNAAVARTMAGTASASVPTASETARVEAGVEGHKQATHASQRESITWQSTTRTRRPPPQVGSDAIAGEGHPGGVHT